MELSINGESVQVDLVSKETPLREYIKTKVSVPGREVFLHCVNLCMELAISVVGNYGSELLRCIYYKTMLLDSS